MNITAIAAAGICASVLAVAVKNIKSETGQLITVAAAVSVMLAVLPYTEVVVSAIREFSSLSSLGGRYLTPVLKITGIAYVTQIGAELCRDSGENAIAQSVETAGKIAITVTALPVAREAFVKIMEILS